MVKTRRKDWLLTGLAGRSLLLAFPDYTPMKGPKNVCKVLTRRQKANRSCPGTPPKTSGNLEILWKLGHTLRQQYEECVVTRSDGGDSTEEVLRIADVG